MRSLRAILVLLLMISVVPSVSAQRGSSPAHIENLTAEVREDGIFLTWDHPYPVEQRNRFPNTEDPALFHVYRKAADGGWEEIATLNARTTEEYFDQSASPRTTYTYTVTYDDGVESCGSGPGYCPEDEITVTTIPFFPSPLALVLALVGSAGMVAFVIRRRSSL